MEFLAVPALEPGLAAEIGNRLAGMDPWQTLGYSAETLARGLASPHPAVTRYLAMEGDEPQGLVVVRYPWLRGAYIELFAILPGPRAGASVARPWRSSSPTIAGAPPTSGCWSRASMPTLGVSTSCRAFSRSGSSRTWWWRARMRF